MTALEVISTKLDGIASQLTALEEGQASLQQSISALGSKTSTANLPAGDGPVAPDAFSLHKEDYDGFTTREWRLLNCLWGKRAVEEEEVLEEVYGHDNDGKEGALRSLRKRLNRKLHKKKFPGSVVLVNGYLSLKMFRQPEGVTKGS